MAERGRRVFLTGATGFIGGRVACLLAERGDRLSCLVRDTSRAPPLEALGAEIVEGDINDDIALRRGLEDADVAFHIAGVYDTGRVDEGRLERANVDGTRTFLQYARYAEVPLSVYVSTAVALGPTDTERAEDIAWNGPFPSIYHRTKTHAHRLAKEAQARGQPLAIVCPTFVYGPRDEGPAGQFISDLLRRRLPGLLAHPATFSYAYVDDVARGIVAAAVPDAAGEVFVLGGERADVNDFAARVCALARVKPPALRFPVGVARVTARLLDGVSRVTGMRISLSRENVDVACCRPWAPGWAKAAERLGYTARPIDEGLPPTVAWFLSR